MSSPTSSTSSTASGGKIGSGNTGAPHPNAQWGASGTVLTPSASPNEINSATTDQVVGQGNTNVSEENGSGSGHNATASPGTPPLSSNQHQHHLTLTTLHVRSYFIK